MRQVLYLFISGFLAFLSCTQDKIQMVSLGIDDVYYLPRMKTYLLSPAFTGDEYRWTLHRNGTDSLVSTERSYIFLAKDTGTYQMTFEIIDKETPYKHDFRFEVMHIALIYPKCTTFVPHRVSLSIRCPNTRKAIRKKPY